MKMENTERLPGASAEQRVFVREDPVAATHVEGHVVEAVADIPEPRLVPERVKAIAEDEQIVCKLPPETQRRCMSFAGQRRVRQAHQAS